MSSRALEPIALSAEFWTRGDVREALRVRDFGLLFRLVRRYAGASQTRIGTSVGLSQGRVSEVMSGTRQITATKVIERVLTGLHAPDQARMLAGLAIRTDVAPAERGPSHMWDGTDLSTPVLSSSEAGRHTTALADVDVLHTARNHFERMYRQVGGLAVQPRIDGFLRAQVRPLLDDPPHKIAGGLYAAAGGLVALAGVCAYDADQQSTAEGHFLRALSLARAADNPTLGGYIAGLIANKALRTGNFSLAIQHAEAALADSARLTPALRADLHCTQAEAYASMGNASSTFRQFVAAEAAAERINLADEPPEAGHVQPGVVEGRQAVALRSLGDLAMAETYAARSAELSTAIHPRGQANQLVTRATLHLAKGDAEAAASVGLTLVDLAQGMESRLIRNRLAGVRKALDPFRSSAAARAFCEQADTLLRMPL